jgi:hypothetical protein
MIYTSLFRLFRGESAGKGFHTSEGVFLGISRRPSRIGMVEVTVMEAIFVGLLVLAVVAVPLALSVWLDRRREQADVIAAAARSAVRQRLGGDAFVTVDVTAPTPWALGRVVLATPAGYGWMVERSWTAVAQRVPADYELVVHAAPSSAERHFPAGDTGLRRAA